MDNNNLYDKPKEENSDIKEKLQQIISNSDNEREHPMQCAFYREALEKTSDSLLLKFFFDTVDDTCESSTVEGLITVYKLFLEKGKNLLWYRVASYVNDSAADPRDFFIVLCTYVNEDVDGDLLQDWAEQCKDAEAFEICILKHLYEQETQKISDLQTEKENLQKRMEAEQGKVSNLRQRLKTQRQRETDEQEISTLQAERDDLQEQVRNLTSENEGLTTQIADLNQQREMEMQNAENLKQQYEEENQNAETLREQYSTLQTEKNDLQTEKDDLQARMEQAEAQIEDLKQQLKKREKYEGRIKFLERKLDRQSKIYERMELAATRKMNEELNRLENENLDLERQLSEERSISDGYLARLNVLLAAQGESHLPMAAKHSINQSEFVPNGDSDYAGDASITDNNGNIITIEYDDADLQPIENRRGESCRIAGVFERIFGKFQLNAFNKLPRAEQDQRVLAKMLDKNYSNHAVRVIGKALESDSTISRGKLIGIMNIRSEDDAVRFCGVDINRQVDDVIKETKAFAS